MVGIQCRWNFFGLVCIGRGVCRCRGRWGRCCCWLRRLRSCLFGSQLGLYLIRNGLLHFRRQRYTAATASTTRILLRAGIALRRRGIGVGRCLRFIRCLQVLADYVVRHPQSCGGVGRIRIEVKAVVSEPGFSAPPPRVNYGRSPRIVGPAVECRTVVVSRHVAVIVAAMVVAAAVSICIVVAATVVRAPHIPVPVASAVATFAVPAVPPGVDQPAASRTPRFDSGSSVRATSDRCAMGGLDRGNSAARNARRVAALGGYSLSRCLCGAALPSSCATLASRVRCAGLAARCCRALSAGSRCCTLTGSCGRPFASGGRSRTFTGSSRGRTLTGGGRRCAFASGGCRRTLVGCGCSAFVGRGGRRSLVRCGGRGPLVSRGRAAVAGRRGATSTGVRGGRGMGCRSSLGRWRTLILLPPSQAGDRDQAYD